MLSRILINTKKQISRSGWSGWGAISVMMLAFLVASIFGGLAYVSDLYIRFIEQKSNMLVFFEVGMDKPTIEDLKAKWETSPYIKNISYTTEEQAYSDYSDFTSKVRPEIYAILKSSTEKKLPSSLDIQIWSLEDLDKITEVIQSDVDEANKKLEIIDTTSTDDAVSTEEQASSTTTASLEELTTGDTSGVASDVTMYKYSTEPGDPPIKLKVDDENLDQLRVVFFAIRLVGIAVIGLLFVVIFFFIFMTVEFRLSNQIEEIGVMQLVGGSLYFIRAPYILEGGFYGFIGSLIASLIIGWILTFTFIINNDSVLAKFAFENFNKLSWPAINAPILALLIFGLALIGFLIGSVSSYISIRRYIR